MYVQIIGELGMWLTQVIGDDWPDDSFCCAFLAILYQPITESHQSNSPESGAISLRSSPSSIESRAVNLEFGFTESQPFWKECARWVGDSLQLCLSVDIVPDSWQQRSVTKDELIDEHLQRQSRVSTPRVEIYYESVRNRISTWEQLTVWVDF